MSPLIKFRASGVGKLMTEPRSKSEGPLSVGAKTYIRELAAQAIFGVEFEADGKALQKGIECEDESIALFNRVRGRNLTKNVERRADEYLTGESDLPDGDSVTDIKTAWSVATFPLCEDDIASTQRTLYQWQLRAYMRLWDKPRARLAYCLVDTPERLIGYEPLPLHVVSHIPEHLRVTVCMEIERDAALEALMVEKIKLARDYYAQVIRDFDATHRERWTDEGADTFPPEPVETADPLAAPGALPTTPIDRPALAPADF